MAKKGNRTRKKHATVERDSWGELTGIIITLVGLLMLLSLIRYSPMDLSFWPFAGSSFSPEDAGSVASRNLIGPIGAFIGFLQVLMLGAAAYLVAGGVIWLGVAVAWFKARPGLRVLGGFVIVVLVSAALANLSGWFGNRWMIPWDGGAIGKALGFASTKLLGSLGSALVLTGVYLMGMILLTGMHPVAFTRRLAEISTEAWADWRENRRSRDSANVKTPRAKAKSRPVKKDADFGETLNKGKMGDSGQAELPLRENPAPQIIDASTRRKPLADIGARPFERKKEGHTGLSTEGFEDYELPGFDLLQYDEHEVETPDNSDELRANQNMIVETLKAFGVEVTAGNITRGPTITRYEVYPGVGLRVSRITQLEADLARATKAEQINILAPIPGKDTVGIEIANDTKVAVPLRELLQDEEFRSSKRKIPLALGKDVYGKTVITDLAAMPHLLVAGATGSGKSVCINSIITSILYKFGPDELRFIMIDPKVVEMQVYKDLPHLVVPVVTDPRKVVGALNWCVNEMERRYKMFAKCGVRNFDGFNKRVRPEKAAEPEEELSEEETPIDDEAIESMARAFEDGDLGPTTTTDEEKEEAEEEIPDRLPYIVIIIDELADLMQTAPADVEMAIARIAQKARAAGIHLIVATQTPRADVVTGIIKANIPSRIAFQVSSALDSRVILDTKGADKLVGQGDMLFLPPGSAKLSRSQGAFVSDEEVEQIIDFCSNQAEQRFEKSIQQSIENGGSSDNSEEDVSDADEEVLTRCVELIVQEGKASTSLLQRRLRLGYTRAARMIDILEQRGVIGPGDGAKPREVLMGGMTEVE